MAKGDWWFKFEFNIWRTDSSLRRCSLETRAFWLECLCVMHETDTYFVEGSVEELGWLIGCSTEIVAKCSVELQRTKTADVTLGNGSVTLLSRRLKRGLSDREQTRLRVQRHRGNANVTRQSKSKSKSKEKEVKNKKEKREETPQAASPKKGTRLPDVFHLTAEMREYGKTKRPEIDLNLETEKFCNFWRSKTGKDATKLNWVLTWKNWILNAKGNNSNGTNRFNNGHKPTPGEIIANRPYRNKADLD